MYSASTKRQRTLFVDGGSLDEGRHVVLGHGVFERGRRQGLLLLHLDLSVVVGRETPPDTSDREAV
jgi:hypothetical protein